MELLADLRGANVGVFGGGKVGAEELFSKLVLKMRIEESKRDMNTKSCCKKYTVLAKGELNVYQTGRRPPPERENRRPDGFPWSSLDLILTWHLDKMKTMIRLGKFHFLSCRTDILLGISSMKNYPTTISLMRDHHCRGFLGRASSSVNSLLPVQISISSSLTQRVLFQSLYTTTKRINTGSKM